MCVYWDPPMRSFSDDRLVAIERRIEANRVVVEHKKFVSKESCDFLVALAPSFLSTLTFLELNVQLASLCSSKITIYEDVFFVETDEFFFVKLNIPSARIIWWQKFSPFAIISSII